MDQINSDGCFSWLTEGQFVGYDNTIVCVCVGECFYFHNIHAGLFMSEVLLL